jgi:hypothetical protein
MKKFIVLTVLFCFNILCFSQENEKKIYYEAIFNYSDLVNNKKNENIKISFVSGFKGNSIRVILNGKKLLDDVLISESTTGHTGKVINWKHSKKKESHFELYVDNKKKLDFFIDKRYKNLYIFYFEGKFRVQYSKDSLEFE